VRKQIVQEIGQLRQIIDRGLFNVRLFVHARALAYRRNV
jgi:hypothetical protein